MIFLRHIRSVGETAAAYLGLAVIPFMPRRVIVWMSGLLGALGFHLSPKMRRVAFANIDIAFGDTLSRAEKTRIVKDSCNTFALVLLDLFWFARWTKKRVARYVRYDASCEAFFSVKPAVLVTGHIGNWEILSHAVSLRDPPFLAVAAHLKNGAVDRLVRRLRRGSGQQVVFKEGAIRQTLRMLKEGGRVGLVLDQNIRIEEGGIFVKLFGLPVAMSVAPETIAARTGLPITFIFCIPKGKGYYECHSPPAVVPGHVDQKQGAVTQAIARVFEDEIRQNPGYWVWMYRRWKFIPHDHPKDKYPFYARVVERKGRGGGDT